MKKHSLVYLFLIAIFLLTPTLSFAATGFSIGTLRIEFILFALTLIGVALFHSHTMWVALGGFTSILITQYVTIPDFSFYHHLFGIHHEWRVLLNLLGLLFGFAILAKHFEESNVPEWLPRLFPDDWKGGFALLAMIFVMSSFLDNIAAAMIGGTIARFVFKGKVHIGFLAAIVAASNAGGAWSVVGDTTTTLMWIDGVSVFVIFRAIIASTVALFVFGIFASKQQDKHCRIVKDAPKNLSINWKKLTVVAMILIGAILTNFLLDFPAIGVWIAILVGAMFINTPWVEVKHSLKGTIFLLALVSCASLMPVDDLPPASMWSAFALGFISAVFDNIPLTKLCLVQGGYDWGVLAYSVGFGGSMIWFGSSAGVALSNMYPEAKDVLKYVKHGWHVTLAYVVGFFVMIALIGWHAPDSHKQFEIKIHQLPQMPVENTNQTIESH